MVTHKPKWLYWNDLAFVPAPPDTHKTVVSGHYYLNNAIGYDQRRLIDTACGYGGELTALLLPEDQIVQPESEKKFKKSPMPMARLVKKDPEPPPKPKHWSVDWAKHFFA